MKELLFLIILVTSNLFSLEEKKEIKPTIPEGITAAQKEFLEKNPDLIDVFNACSRDPKDSSSLSECMYKEASPETKKNLDQIEKAKDQKNKEKNAFRTTQAFLERAIDEQNPVIVEMEKFLYEQMKEILFKDGTQVVDQIEFFKLHKTQTSKEILLAFSQFCMNYDASCKRLKPEEEAKKVLASPRKTQEDWAKCFSKIPVLCEKGNADSECTQQACLVVNFVKRSRNHLVKVNELHQKITDYSSSPTTEITSGVDVYRSKKNVDILAYGSEDIGKKVEVATIQQENFFKEKCNQENYESHKKECDAILMKKSDETIKAEITEYGIKAEHFTETLKSDTDLKEKITKHLAEEGRTKETIESLTKDEEALKKTREVILSKYEKEKAALIEKLNNELAQNQKKTEKNSFSAAEKTTQTKDLIRYNNIVSGLLVTQEKDENDEIKNVGQNVAVINAELNQKSLTKEQKKEMDTLRKHLESSDVNLSNPQNNTDAELTTEQINKIFKVNESEEEE